MGSPPKPLIRIAADLCATVKDSEKDKQADEILEAVPEKTAPNLTDKFCQSIEDADMLELTGCRDFREVGLPKAKEDGPSEVSDKSR